MEGFELTHHAQRQLKERAIQECWVEATLSQPDRQLPVADAFGNTHYLNRLPSLAIAGCASLLIQPLIPNAL
jgi:hypothetical protein